MAVLCAGAAKSQTASPPTGAALNLSAPRLLCAFEICLQPRDRIGFRSRPRLGGQPAYVLPRLGLAGFRVTVGLMVVLNIGETLLSIGMTLGDHLVG